MREKVDSCPKANVPLIISGQALLKGNFTGIQTEEEAKCRNNTVSSDSHFFFNLFMLVGG